MYRLCCLIAAVLCLGCNDVPIDGLNAVQVHVTTRSASTDKVKVDFLWVIDQSSSMGHEQAALSNSFNSFLDTLEVGVQGLDTRMAVVTMDAISPEHSGLFRHHPAQEFGRLAATRRIVECASKETADAACATLGPQWVGAGGTPHFSGKTMCSCRYGCQTDTECEAVLGVGSGGAYCLIDEPFSGCIPRPDTAACPDAETLRQRLIAETGTVPFVTGENARELFKCAAVVGVAQDSSTWQEQGINSALLALDRHGPNAEQAHAFLRDDAWLVVVFVSDEEDCSTAPGQTISLEQSQRCSCYPQKMLPVTNAVNKLKGLKADPSRVLVAGIVGTADSDEDAAAFLDWRCSVTGPVTPFTCQSLGGTAELGNRYIGLIDGFGPNGILASVCGHGGFGPALEQIATRIVSVISNICLPADVLDPASIVGTLHRADGTTTQDVAFEPVPAADCDDEAGASALKLATPLNPGEWVEVSYQAAAVQ